MMLEEGQILFHEGDIGKKLYIVRSGELRGTSTISTGVTSYGPGALIGELGLLKNDPSSETITAVEDSELQVITQETLNGALEKEPGWFKSIIQFLTGRLAIAQSNKRKSDKIKALPSLLYELISLAEKANENEISATELIRNEQVLFNIASDDILSLVHILEDLEMVKLQGGSIRIKSLNVAKLLYESICFRANYRKTPPQILSMTDQMVLSAVIKTVQQSKAPLASGIFKITTADLLKTAHKTLHGITLTTRILYPLVDRKLLESATPLKNTEALPELETVPFICGDFDTILDLMELNRIYPLLDKKLV